MENDDRMEEKKRKRGNRQCFTFLAPFSFASNIWNYKTCVGAQKY